MHQRNSIINIPLLGGIVLSVALHGAALYSKGVYSPPKPAMKQGRTVVRLTLVPSRASKGKPKPVPQAVRPPEPVPTPTPAHTRTGDMHVAPTTSPAKKTAPEQDASPIEEKGVTIEAQTFKAASPTYPRLSRRRGEEGTVLLSIEVLANGQAGKISVIQSSGYRRLDEAALQAARKTTFTPAKQSGQSIDSTTELPFTFRLTDD